MSAKSLRDYNFRKQKVFSKKSKNMKEAIFIYKNVQSEAHINSLGFHIGASNRSPLKRIYDLKIRKFPKIPSQGKVNQSSTMNSKYNKEVIKTCLTAPWDQKVNSTMTLTYITAL